MDKIKQINIFILHTLTVVLFVSQSSLVYAQDCLQVLALSVNDETTLINKEEYSKKAESFCKSYSKSTGNKGSRDLGVKFKVLELSNSSGVNKTKSLHEALCKSSGGTKMIDNAYEKYIRSLAPGAYDAYETCLSNDSGLDVNVLNKSETDVVFSVTFNTNRHGVKADLDVVHTKGVIHCSFNGGTLVNGQKEMFICSRNIERNGFTPPSVISIYDKNTSDKGSELTFPWPVYRQSSNLIKNESLHIVESNSTLLHIEDVSCKTAKESDKCVMKVNWASPPHGQQAIVRVGENKEKYFSCKSLVGSKVSEIANWEFRKQPTHFWLYYVSSDSPTFGCTDKIPNTNPVSMSYVYFK